MLFQYQGVYVSDFLIHSSIDGHFGCFHTLGFPSASESKESACTQETWVQSLGQEDPLEKGMATHSSILDWRIPWMEEAAG